MHSGYEKKFNVGDKVRLLTDEGNYRKGETAYIAQVDEDSGASQPYMLSAEKGTRRRTYWVYGHMIELADGPQEQKSGSYEYKVGEKVDWDYGGTKGIGYIVKLKEGHMDYLVEVDQKGWSRRREVPEDWVRKITDQYYWLNDSHLTPRIDNDLTPGPEKSEERTFNPSDFKEGVKVRIRKTKSGGGCYYEYFDDVLEAKTGPDYAGDVQVWEKDHSDWHWYHYTNLILVEEEQEQVKSEPEVEWKVGDKFRVLRHACSDIDSIKKIIRDRVILTVRTVSEQHVYSEQEWDKYRYDTSWAFEMKNIERVTEEKPEPKAPESFEIGDERFYSGETVWFVKESNEYKAADGILGTQYQYRKGVLVLKDRAKDVLIEPLEKNGNTYTGGCARIAMSECDSFNYENRTSEGYYTWIYKSEFNRAYQPIMRYSESDKRPILLKRGGRKGKYTVGRQGEAAIGIDPADEKGDSSVIETIEGYGRISSGRMMRAVDAIREGQILHVSHTQDGQTFAAPIEDGEIIKSNASSDAHHKSMSVKSFIKRSLLTKEEKLLRKFYLKNECGEYTQEAIDAVILKLVDDNKPYLVELAKGMAKEQKDADNDDE